MDLSFCNMVPAFAL